MVDWQRRDFLRAAALAAGGGAIAPDTLGAAASPMQFTLQGGSSARAAPFCLGFAFRRGDVPAGRRVVSDRGTLQVTPRNAWSDGSLKFALLAGHAEVPASGGGVVVTLRHAAPGSGDRALTLADLQQTGVAAEVDCGRFGVSAWAADDWNRPWRSWAAGPEMSSWIYRRPVGQDPHLVAWLEVRLFAGGAVEVLPWVENGCLKVAGPTDKTAAYGFSLGHRRRFSATIVLCHHQRTVLVDGSAQSHWLATDPRILACQDLRYLQATELVPSYRARIAPDSALVARLSDRFTPLQQGSFSYNDDDMAGPGYQEPIGLLPLHDVLCLAGGHLAKTHAAVVMNGYGAGRYPLHYRDETTQRPLRFSQHPTLVISGGSGFKDCGSSSTRSYTPVVAGARPPPWDVAHGPSLGYLAYLLTGRWYFMEQVQFVATANYLGKDDGPEMRTGGKGLVQTAVQAWQTRSCAWDWRALVQALCVTPDDDSALRGEFVGCVEANIDHFYGRYVAQPNNPYGWIKPGEDSYDRSLRTGAPWQQDFVTGAFGHSLCLDLPIAAASAARLAAFFQWKAKSVVSRLGPKSAFWYINAVPYTMTITPSARPDYESGAGPWYADDAQVYAATYADPPPWLGRTENRLAAEIMPGERSFWGNLQPAIAYAVRHGVPGALAAYERMTGAANWPALRDAFDVQPVWSVMPAKIS